MVNNSIKEIFILLDFLFENLHCKEPNKRFWIEEGSDYVNKLVEALIKDNTAQKIIANQNLQGDSSRIQKTYTKSPLLDAYIRFIFFSNTDSIKAILSNSEMQAYIYDTDFLKRNALYPFSFENLHHIICDKFFKNLYSDDSPKKKFWVQLEHNDTFIRDMDYTDLSDHNRGYLRLTVLSEDMLDYDRFIFDYLSEQGNQVEESNLTIFRPYFSEYYFDTKDLNQSQKKFLMNRMNHETWFNAYILPNDEQYPDDSEDIVFDGAYVYSASPVVYVGRKLVIQNSSIDRELLDKIVKTYNIPGEYCSSHVNIRDELQKN